jgi:hypothetical protein
MYQACPTHVLLCFLELYMLVMVSRMKPSIVFMTFKARIYCETFAEIKNLKFAKTKKKRAEKTPLFFSFSESTTGLRVVPRKKR